MVQLHNSVCDTTCPRWAEILSRHYPISGWVGFLVHIHPLPRPVGGKEVRDIDICVDRVVVESITISRSIIPIVEIRSTRLRWCRAFPHIVSLPLVVARLRTIVSGPICCSPFMFCSPFGGLPQRWWRRMQPHHRLILSRVWLSRVWSRVRNVRRSQGRNISLSWSSRDRHIPIYTLLNLKVGKQGSLKCRVLIRRSLHRNSLNASARSSTEFSANHFLVEIAIHGYVRSDMTSGSRESRVEIDIIISPPLSQPALLCLLRLQHLSLQSPYVQSALVIQRLEVDIRFDSRGRGIDATIEMTVMRTVRHVTPNRGRRLAKRISLRNCSRWRSRRNTKV
jgi:hypothetical protein